MQQETKTAQAPQEQRRDAGAECAPVPVEKRPELTRVLKVSTPHMTGDDVGAVHKELARCRFRCGGDAEKKEYGTATAKAVRHFQAANAPLMVTGWVDRDTAVALGIAWGNKK